MAEYIDLVIVDNNLCMHNFIEQEKQNFPKSYFFNSRYVKSMVQNGSRNFLGAKAE